MCISVRNVLKISGVVAMQSHFNDFKYHICVSLLGMFLRFQEGGGCGADGRYHGRRVAGGDTMGRGGCS